MVLMRTKFAQNAPSCTVGIICFHKWLVYLCGKIGTRNQLFIGFTLQLPSSDKKKGKKVREKGKKMNNKGSVRSRGQLLGRKGAKN